MKLLLATLGLLFSVSPSLGASTGAPNLVHFEQSRKNEGFVLDLAFSRIVSGDQVGVQYVEDGIEVFVSGAKAPHADKSVLVDDPQVASIGYSANSKGLKFKIGVVPGIQPASLKNNFQFAVHGKHIALVVGEASALAPVSSIAKPSAAAEAAIDADLEAQLQALNKATESKAPTAVTPAALATTSNVAAAVSSNQKKAEAEPITKVAVADDESAPVFNKKEAAVGAVAAATSAAGKTTSIKLILTLCVIGVLGAGAYFAAKKWPTKRTKGKKHMIQILSQSYLGPKKSLAVVQVAGETVLIGVTDSNISLIKTLALIDDEVVPDNKGKFVDALNNSEQEFDANDVALRLSQNVEDDFTMQGLKSVVDGKLKNMRSF